MISHIKDLFHKRKERQQNKFFNRSYSFDNSRTLKTATATTENTTHSNNMSMVKDYPKEIRSNKSADSMTLSDVCQRINNKSSNADELASMLIEQSKKRKSHLPLYPGMERFEMIKKLGDGAFSNVYEARDSLTGKKVAIKVAQKSNPTSDKRTGQRHLHQNIQKKPRMTERANIMKEVQIMRNVKHSNIVQLIHFTESYENYFLTLDLCEGGELFHRIVKLTYFSENLSRHVITQVALAVRHLHEECGVVHRDIKPENILFESIPIIPSKKRILRPTDNPDTKEDEGEFIRGLGGGGVGRVKLADFGLSKVIWNNSTFTPCGTVGYTAPEIVCDQHYSKSVDMWAIGCVLYTILCGFPPFYDESIPSLTEKVAKGQYTFLSPWWDTMSDSVKDLISHLLCVDAKKRYTIDQLLSHPWMNEEPFIRPDNRQNVYTNTNSVKKEQQKEQEEVESLVQQAIQSNMLTPPDIINDDMTIDLDDATLYSTPNAATLREIFDITYAVQRMGEEQSLDKNQTKPKRQNTVRQYQALDSPTLPKERKKMNVQVPLAQQTQNLAIAEKLAHKSRGVADPNNYRNHITSHVQRQTQMPPNVFDGFQLDMDRATLLQSRKNAGNSHTVTPPASTAPSIVATRVKV